MCSLPITLHFENPAHQQFHEMLVPFGFCFEVTPRNSTVGLCYRHSDKAIEVQLSYGEDDLFAVTCDLTKSAGERINTEESYTPLEWEWVENADSEIEFLRRELHILVDVRPKSLTKDTRRFDK